MYNVNEEKMYSDELLNVNLQEEIYTEFYSYINISHYIRVISLSPERRLPK